MYGGLQIIQTGANGCCITVRPNCSLSLTGKALVLASFLLVLSVVSGAFAVVGAWPVIPFAGLEMLVITGAFYQMACHERDYERITIDGDIIVFERRDNVRYMRAEYRRCWTRVMLQCQSVGRQSSVTLCSHGVEQQLGRHLNDEQRSELAFQLVQRLGSQ